MPEILFNQSFNMGFESIAVNRKGTKIFAIMEGFLDFKIGTENPAEVIRFIVKDRKSGETKMLLYPIEKSFYGNNKVKIGDMAYIDDEHFLVVEQGKNHKGEMQNRIFFINISKATDISSANKPDDHFESNNINILEQDGYHLIEKKLFLNLRDHNWKYEKLEGLTIINEHTIAIANDNDFCQENIGNCDSEIWIIGLNKEIPYYE